MIKDITQRRASNNAWNKRNHKPCAEAQARYRATLKGRGDYVEYKRKCHLSSRFGMSLEDYSKLFVRQNGVCAICRKPETAVLRGKVRHLAVDHNHRTGRVRGLLCSICNAALGYLKDDPAYARMAADYLEKDGVCDGE